MLSPTRDNAGAHPSAAGGAPAGPLTLVAAITIALAACSATAQPEVLSAAVNAANGKTYVLLAPSTWTAAEARAVELGGHLATVRNLAENDFIYDTFSVFGGQNRNLWIGLYDLDQAVNSTDRAIRRLEFGWISGEPTVFSHWSAVEPNNPASPEPAVWEFYVHLWSPADINRRRWNNLQDRPQVFGLPVCGVAEVCIYVPDAGDRIVCPAGSAVLTAAAVGAGSLIFRWQIEDPPAPGGWLDLSDGPIIRAGSPVGTAAGAATPTLTIDPDESLYPSGVFGSFRCLVTNSCGSFAGPASVVTVCPADSNCDGALNSADISAFLALWLASISGGTLEADFNADGTVNSNDISAFLTAWIAAVQGAC